MSFVPLLAWECQSYEFYCEKSRRCINKDLRCNGHGDCHGWQGLDDSDEKDCPGKSLKV